MLNKKIFLGIVASFFLFLILINIFSTALVHAQDEPPMPGDVEKIQNFSEKTTKTIEELREQEKREYLFNEWRKMLLENKAVSILDSFFTKISPVFLVLFGEPYTLSGFLFLVVILWFYFFFKLSEIFIDYSAFSEGICWVMGLGITIVMAQTKMLRKIAEFFVWLAFYKEATWWRFLIVIGLIIGLIVLYQLSSQVGKSQKEAKKKREEEINRAKLKAGAKIAEGMIEGTK